MASKAGSVPVAFYPLGSNCFASPLLFSRGENASKGSILKASALLVATWTVVVPEMNIALLHIGEYCKWQIQLSLVI